MTLKKRAERFAEKAIKTTDKQKWVSLWEVESNYIQGFNNTRNGERVKFSTHTIVKYTSMCRKSIQNMLNNQSKKDSKEIENLIKEVIVTQNNKRQEKRELDSKSLNIYTDGQQVITIKSPKKLIEKCVDSALNSWQHKELLVALGVLTGRRCSELVRIAFFKDYQYIDEKHIRVGQLLKGSVDSAIIPVFGGSLNVIEGFKNLAETLSEDLSYLSNEEIKQRYSPQATRFSKEYLKGFYSVNAKGSILKKWTPTIHQTRKIYTILANTFVMSKSEIVTQLGGKFTTVILGHSASTSDNHYDFIQIENTDSYVW